jgi:hypothetical protein
MQRGFFVGYLAGAFRAPASSAPTSFVARTARAVTSKQEMSYMHSRIREVHSLASAMREEPQEDHVRVLAPQRWNPVEPSTRSTSGPSQSATSSISDWASVDMPLSARKAEKQRARDQPEALHVCDRPTENQCPDLSLTAAHLVMKGGSTQGTVFAFPHAEKRSGLLRSQGTRL